jgi:hypothetical protein
MPAKSSFCTSPLCYDNPDHYLWGRDRTPSPWAVRHIGIVGLCAVAIVPIVRYGLGHHRRGSHHWWVHLIGPVRLPTPIRPPKCPEPDPHADPWASIPVVEAMVGAVASMPMAFEPVVEAVPFVPMAMASEPVAPRSMPAAIGIPWQGAEAEQHRQHDEYPHPLQPCAHGLTFLASPGPDPLRASMLLFPSIVPTTSPALPLQSPQRRAPGLSTVADDSLRMGSGEPGSLPTGVKDVVVRMAGEVIVLHDTKSLFLPRPLLSRSAITVWRPCMPARRGFLPFPIELGHLPT